MYKQFIYTLLLIFTTQTIWSQIDSGSLLGLNTGNTAEINAITDAEMGSLVYNTTDSSIYQFTGGTWIRVFDSANNGTTDSKINFGGRWTNTDTTTNLNVTNVVAPIFGNEDYKDDGNILYEVVGNTLLVKESGRYEIKANLSFTLFSSIRSNASARIAINGTQIGSRAASGYIRNGSGHTQSSIHINEILNLNANDIISIVMFREASASTVRFSAVNESSFIINKLR